MYSENIIRYYKGLIRRDNNSNFDVDVATNDEIVEHGRALESGGLASESNEVKRVRDENSRRARIEVERTVAQRKEREIIAKQRENQRIAEAVERQQEQIKLAQIREETRKQQEAESQEKLKQRLEKWRSNPVGIRRSSDFRYICLICGNKVPSLKDGGYGYTVPIEGTIKCHKCQNTWYFNHCWNCKKGLLDDRDPEVQRCQSCGWLKCEDCGACRKLGCVTHSNSNSRRGFERQQKLTSEIDGDLDNLDDLIDPFTS